jgi:fermentation-respiration switch protein FrsA (DUF1100 family)
MSPLVRSGLRWIGRAVGLLALLFAGLLAVLTAFQNSFIFPGAALQGRAEARVEPPPGCELLHLKTAAGEPVTALFGPALTEQGQPRPDAASQPTVLYFYGNGMCLAAALDTFETFRRLGANVLVPDYLGYGLSGGRPSEAGCYATADAAYDYLRSRPEGDPRRLVVAGWSLGGAVAIDLASRRPLAALAVFSTFTSLDDVARAHFPFLPVSLLLQQHFESEKKLARVTCPILIGHGRRDSIIPFSMMARLVAACRTPSVQLAIEDADHNDFFEIAGIPLRDAFRRFLDDLP